MISQEQLETVAALVNYYKFSKIDVDWMYVAKEYNDEYDLKTDAKTLEEEYDENHTEELDNLFIIDKILSLFIERRKIFANVVWKGFPTSYVDKLDITQIDQSIIEDYCVENTSDFDNIIAQADARQLKTLAGITKGTSYEKILAVIESRKMDKRRNSKSVTQSYATNPTQSPLPPTQPYAQFESPKLALSEEQPAAEPVAEPVIQNEIIETSPCVYTVNFPEEKNEGSSAKVVFASASFVNLVKIQEHSHLEGPTLTQLSRDGHLFVIMNDNNEAVGHFVYFYLNCDIKIIHEIVLYTPGYVQCLDTLHACLIAVRPNEAAMPALHSRGFYPVGTIIIDNYAICLMRK